MLLPRPALLLSSLLLASSVFAADEAPSHYRCQIDGKTVFQDFPCDQIRKQQPLRPLPAPAPAAAPAPAGSTPKIGSKESMQALNERLAKERRRTDINYEILDLETELAKLDKKRQADVQAEMDKPIVNRNPAFRLELEKERDKLIKQINDGFIVQRKAIETQIAGLFKESGQLSTQLKLPAVEKPATLVAAEARAAAEAKAKEAAAKGK